MANYQNQRYRPRTGQRTQVTPPSSSESGRHRAPAMQRQRGLSVVIAASILVLLAIGYIVFQMFSGNGLFVSKDYSGSGNGQPILVEIKEGSTVSELGPELVEKGVVKSNTAFLAAANASPAAGDVQPGFYRLQGEMSSTAAVDALLDPANKVEPLKVVGGATLNDVRVVGGDTRFGIFTLLSQATCHDGSPKCIPVEQFRDAAGKTPLDQLGVPDWAMQAVLARGDDPRRIEGLIAPGEYIINPQESPSTILRTLIVKSVDIYNKSGIVQAAEANNLSPYELLIAASLVEREAPAGDFDKVARVILNRLAIDMALQFDSTVNYDLPEQEVQTNDSDRERVTPWNTYASPGLPATPISSPSEKAITAMEHPAEGPWLYFVTIDQSGTTEFNETLEQHNASVAKAQQSGVLDSAR